LGSTGIKVTRNELTITVELPGALTFESGSAKLSPRAVALLTSVAKVLVDYRFSVVSVHGYTDNSGDSSQNQLLSESRAIAVARQLAADSVTVDRLLVVGRGSSDPAMSNDTPEGREANRRIVLQLDPLVP
jgi:outer membrane protein OmpA-like peptidoglycan-associated protein